jgi:multidrug efflux pump subunit AcrB
MVMLVGLVTLLLLSCAGSPSSFQPTIDQGLAIMKQVNFESPPDTKLQTAQELLAHAEQYERQLTASSAPDTRREAQRLRRSERATASILMRDAAADYAKQNQADKARDLYRRILTTFTGDYEASFRESAEAALKALDQGQGK